MVLSSSLRLTIILLILNSTMCGNSSSLNNNSSQNFPAINAGVNGNTRVGNVALPSSCRNKIGFASKFCSPWSFYQNSENGTRRCKCGTLPENIILCGLDGETSVLDRYCITYDENLDLIESGNCVYNTGSLHAKNHPDKRA